MRVDTDDTCRYGLTESCCRQVSPWINDLAMEGHAEMMLIESISNGTSEDKEMGRIENGLPYLPSNANDDEELEMEGCLYFCDSMLSIGAPKLASQATR
ncbi:hypothetical protein HPP92_016781 [Vanilla planifolia]|uniref:Uncharacterized protein n=1 Tax=Vanilla planifolia TaxID=51239 RepID=A0A835QFF6_VANPL|nr:hypothetical protein HPP92_016781 [Vanilla planifolia]